MVANLTYGPPMNTDIGYYRTFLTFCKCCDFIISCAIFVWRGEASACLIMVSTKQGSYWYHFNPFGMARPGFGPTILRDRSGCCTTGPAGQVSNAEILNFLLYGRLCDFALSTVHL